MFEIRDIYIIWTQITQRELAVDVDTSHRYLIMSPVSQNSLLSVFKIIIREMNASEIKITLHLESRSTSYWKVCLNLSVLVTIVSNLLSDDSGWNTQISQQNVSFEGIFFLELVHEINICLSDGGTFRGTYSVDKCVS